ncbi:hypothetical protein [Kordia sp.]|uniref:hypothetical protein n=1 Tax=Kordia sp. TaxID=1965332 RepID=UPI003D6BB4DF
MKKKNLKSLKLNKKFVANFNELAGGKAGTCEGPCQGGTGCCNGGNSGLCVSETVGAEHCNCMPRDH